MTLKSLWKQLEENNADVGYCKRNMDVEGFIAFKNAILEDLDANSTYEDAVKEVNKILRSN